MCFDFVYSFISETFFIIRRNERDMIKNVYWSSCKAATHYSCQILMRLEVSRQFCEQYSDITFHENPSIGSRVVSRRQTNITKPIVALLNFANAPKKESYIPTGFVVQRKTFARPNVVV